MEGKPVTMYTSAVPAVTPVESSVPANLIVIRGNGNGQPPAPPRLPSKQPEIVQMPFSPGTQLIDDVLMAGDLDGIKLLCSRKKKNLGCRPEIRMQDNRLWLTYEKNKHFTVVEVTDMETLQKGHVPARKLFGFLRMKLNQGIVIDGELVQKELTFPLQDLVDAGLYNSVTSARRGFNAAMPVLTAVKIRMEMKHSQEKNSAGEALAPFKDASIQSGICKVKLNPDFCWKTFFAFYAPTPTWLFSLPFSAQALGLYLHEIARQHADDVATGEQISIKFETLRCKLCLPENTNWNGCRDVLGGLLRAVEAIEIRQSEFLQDADLKAKDRAGERWFGEIPGLCFGFGTSEEEPKTMKEFQTARLTFTVGGPVRAALANFSRRKKEKAEKSRAKAEMKQNAINTLIATRTVEKMAREGRKGSRSAVPSPEKKQGQTKQRQS